MGTEPITLAKAAPLVAKLASIFAEPAKGVATRTKEKLEVKFRRGFARFIDKNLSRFSTIKTIISSSTPIPLRSVYVNLFLAHSDRAHRDEDFLSEINNYKYVLFTATGGSGKSMLMKYLYLQFLESQTDRLPVFIELRELNEHPKVTVREYICSKIADYIDGFSEQQLKYAFESGRIILFLDGFDEINYDQRKDRERQINELSVRFKDLWMFVSSRPAETFSNWEKFYVFDVQPFTEKQVAMLIDKITYDEEVKGLFRKKLSEGLYESHKEFLTNPLLTIMMLITLEQFAEVPAKIHLFYEYAFEALFGRHDVTKGGFQRKRHTSLALDDFKRLFAYFCIITYLQKMQSFSSERVLEVIQQSVTSAQIEVDKVAFRNDLTDSSCMLVPDGLDYTFSHRSFQEYFAAYFLARVKPDEFQRIIPKLMQRGAFDNVLLMLSEMNKEKFEEAWALPALRRLCDLVVNIDTRKNLLSFGAALLGGKQPFLMITDNTHSESYKIWVLFSDESLEHSTESERSEISTSRLVLYHIYGLFDRIYAHLKRMNVADGEILSRIQNGELFRNDSRFESMRKLSNPMQRGGPGILLNEDDNGWLQDTFFGRFMEMERKLLLKLADEVEHRVSERQRGLAAIFPS